MTVSASSAVAGELRRLLANSHAPYSGVRVAAGVEDAEGTAHFGVNVENAAYPQGLCAEASAIAAMVTQGRRSIRRVWVASSLTEPVWPCGGCRQKIWEFAGPDCEVVSVCSDGEAQSRDMAELLPFGFRLPPRR
jgi:cytidine deaminase